MQPVHQYRLYPARQPKPYDRCATAASSRSSMFRRSVLNCSSKSAVDGGPYRSASVNATSAQSAGCNVSTIAGKITSSSKAICFSLIVDEVADNPVDVLT